MSYNWLEDLESLIGLFIEQHDLDPKQAWEEIGEMAKDNASEGGDNL